MKNIAVITGASSGMGREFCLQLDNEKFDEIWGIALDQEGLNETAKMLKTPFRGFAFDLTEEESFNKYSKLLAEEKPNVLWLANCSGYGKFGRYDEVATEQSSNMIELNCKALQRMTEYTIPYMQKGARILNIASIAAFQPIPYMAVYGASKAFVLSYSRAISVELKNKGISVTCLSPFWTKTNFFKRATETNAKGTVVTKYVTMYDPKKVVKRAIAAAKKRRRNTTYGFISHVHIMLVSILPTSLIMKIWCRQQKLNKRYKNK